MNIDKLLNMITTIIIIINIIIILFYRIQKPYWIRWIIWVTAEEHASFAVAGAIRLDGEATEQWRWITVDCNVSHKDGITDDPAYRKHFPTIFDLPPYRDISLVSNLKNPLRLYHILGMQIRTKKNEADTKSYWGHSLNHHFALTIKPQS